MKVIIAGSRDIHDYEIVKEAVKASGFHITEVVSGHARGVDQNGECWAFDNDVPFKIFEANWQEYGRSAGPKRNMDMANYVGTNGGLIAVWDGLSRGTKHMIEYANSKGLQVFVYNVKKKRV